MTQNNDIMLPVGAPNSPITKGLTGLGLAAILSTGCIQSAPLIGAPQAQQVHSYQVPVSATTAALPVQGRTRADRNAPKIFLNLDHSDLEVTITDNAGTGILNSGSNQDYAGSALTSGLESYSINVCGVDLPLVATINVPLGTEKFELNVGYNPKVGIDIGICPVSITARDNVGNSATETADLYIFNGNVIDRSLEYNAPNFGADSSGNILNAQVENGELSFTGVAKSEAGITKLVLEESQSGVYRVVGTEVFKAYSTEKNLSKLDGYEQPGRTGLYRLTAETADSQKVQLDFECNIPKGDFKAKDPSTYDTLCESL